MRKRLLIFLFCLLLAGAGFLLSAAPGQAQQGPTPPPAVPTPSDDAVNQVAKQLYCPVCENIPLDVCPTQACQDWRELIRQKLALGWSTQQIRDYFAAQYGDRVLSEPPTRGLNWLVYLLPPGAFVAGAVIVWRVMVNSRRKDGPGSDAAPPAPPSHDPYLARLEEELKQKEKQ